MDVRRADLAQVRAFQLAILRPNGPLPTDTELPRDWCHLGAWHDGELIGAASAGPRPWPDEDLALVPTPTWQLRSMAVAPPWRSRGTGARLLARLRSEAGTAGARSLWAEARTAALALYLRDGWIVVGDEWDKPGVGPHRYIWTEVP